MKKYIVLLVISFFYLVGCELDEYGNQRTEQSSKNVNHSQELPPPAVVPVPGAFILSVIGAGMVLNARKRLERIKND